MKQNITRKELDHLNHRQYDCLLTYFPDNIYLSIGQMIGFLENNFVAFQRSDGLDYEGNIIRQWEITIYSASEGKNVTYEGEELCDALWLAVRDKLSVTNLNEK